MANRPWDPVLSLSAFVSLISSSTEEEVLFFYRRLTTRDGHRKISSMSMANYKDASSYTVPEGTSIFGSEDGRAKEL